VTNESLMHAAQEGDLAALGELFERHHRAVFQFLCRTTGDRQASEDLVQDVFMRILKYRHTYDPASRFETWLFRIARNARADYFRRRPPVAAAVEEAWDLPSDSEGPEERLERQLDTGRLQRALRELPDEPRDLLVLARFHAMPYGEIAALLGIEVGTVKVRVFRATQQLRTLFLRLEETPCAVKK
jgi:RNA polymerase sigma factor (sigma-70 family)